MHEPLHVLKKRKHEKVRRKKPLDDVGVSRDAKNRGSTLGEVHLAQLMHLGRSAHLETSSKNAKFYQVSKLKF